METAASLAAIPRNEFGKGPSRRLRLTGNIPAVVYGTNIEPFHVAVQAKELVERMTGEYGLNACFKLNVDGAEGHTVMVKEYQRDPVRRELTHADFVVVDPEKVFQCRVPLVLTGRALGVANGGKLRQIRRDLKIATTVANIPKAITADVTKMKIGHFMRIATVEAPDGVSIIFNSNYAVAAVEVPRGITVTEDEEEEGAGEE